MNFTLNGKKLRHSRDQFIDAGIIISDANNDMLDVEVPIGWGVIETERKGYFHILDEYERRRAIYTDMPDARYNMELLCRYNVVCEVEAENMFSLLDNFIRLVVRDCDDRIVYQSSPFKASCSVDYGIEMSNLNDFMFKYYPYWNDPNCYWTI